MTLHILNSDSTGNGYILHAENGESLVIEAGVPTKLLMKNLGRDISKCQGCVISHEHLDHSKHFEAYIGTGISVFASPGTTNALISRAKSKYASLVTPIKTGQPQTIGSFKVISFDLNHDVAEPTGFFINHPESGNVLFITDSHYLNKRFKNLNNIIIEANYCEDILNKNLREERIHAALANRIKNSHMSIETALRFLSEQDLSKVNNIVLAHLSATNSNAKDFADQVRNKIGGTVHVAAREMSINFNKTPF